jgi:gentisate 1,2-dioxygenase
MSDKLERYYAKIAPLQLMPLWERLSELLPPEPAIASVPYRWDYEALRSIVLESAELIGEDEAERRVLILENPGLPGQSAATETLFAGLQLIMPGEIAPAHRHTMGALRFILESDEAQTSVEGEPLVMRRGDFIVTPSWAWHDHTHEGEAPVIWLDVLDLPAVRALGPRFAGHHPDGRPARAAAAGSSELRYGYNMRPAHSRDESWHSPLRYPFEAAREALANLVSHSDIDPCLGLKLEYVNPTNGDSALPTISAFLQCLPRGFAGREYQATDSGIHCVVEGRGTISVGRGSKRIDFAYKPNDVIAIPCWTPHAFIADEESIIFSATDRAIQTKLGLWRERRGAPAE